MIKLKNEEEILKYYGHSNSRILLDIDYFEYNGNNILISGTEDGQIAYWDMTSGGQCEFITFPDISNEKCINTISCNTNGLIAFASTPDENNYINILQL